MSQVNFGTILREARERKGYDLMTVAHKLRIRPDILRAIEECDFSHMPPRGYARNMISAYASLVGLNPTEMTRMYLDDAYAYQVGLVRTETRTSLYPDRGSLARRNTYAQPSRERTAVQDPRRPTLQSSTGRRTRTDVRESGRGFEAADGRRQAYNTTRQTYGATRRERLYSEDYLHPSRHAALPNSHYTNFYAGPKAPTAIRSKLPLLIAALIIFILLVVVLVLAFGNRNTTTDNPPKVPITGVTDTTQNGGAEGTLGTQAPPVPPKIAPTKVTVEYKIDSGEEIYAVISENGTAKPQMITGPVSDMFDVSGTWSFATWRPYAVHITVDGKAVDFDTTDDDGMPMCVVDFATYLEQWKADNPEVSEETPDTAQHSSSQAGVANSPPPAG